MKIFCSILLWLCAYGIMAQSLPSQVIGTSGDNYMRTSGSLEWTLGEIMIETYLKPVGFLSQGFQQPTKVTITDLEKDIENNIVAYPNPAQGQLNVKISEAGTHTIELFNLQGQKLINEKFIAHPANATFEMDVQPLRAAMYLLRVTNISSGKNHIQKIEKY